MHRRLIIALAGLAQSGKDTAGSHLVQTHGFVRDAFADDLRASTLAIDPWVPVMPECTRHERLSVLVERVGWEEAKKTNPEARRLLQRVATEGGRMVHGDDLWVERVAQRERELAPGVPMVVTDVRFANEEAWVRSQDGVVVRIEREGPSGLAGDLASHVSETYRVDHDYLIGNDGTIEELYASVDAVLRLVLDQSPAERRWLRERS